MKVQQRFHSLFLNSQCFIFGQSKIRPLVLTRVRKKKWSQLFNTSFFFYYTYIINQNEGTTEISQPFPSQCFIFGQSKISSLVLTPSQRVKKGDRDKNFKHIISFTYIGNEFPNEGMYNRTFLHSMELLQQKNRFANI